SDWQRQKAVRRSGTDGSNPASSSRESYANCLPRLNATIAAKDRFRRNEPEGTRTEGSGDGEMKYRRATIVADEWHGEFGSLDEWARLGACSRRASTARSRPCASSSRWRWTGQSWRAGSSSCRIRGGYR